MDHRVSAVASLVVAAACLSGCGASAGKTEMTDACLDKFGGRTELCDCFVTSFESKLSADQFARLSKAVHDNRRFAGDWIPGPIRTDREFRMVVSDANTACVAPA